MQRPQHVRPTRRSLRPAARRRVGASALLLFVAGLLLLPAPLRAEPPAPGAGEPSPPAAAAPRWSLAQFSDAVRSRSPFVRIARGEHDMREADAAAVFWEWMPTLQLVTLMSVSPVQRGNAVSGPGRELDAYDFFVHFRVTGGMPLCTFGRLGGRRTSARAAAAEKWQGVRAAERESEYQLYRAYFGYVLARQIDSAVAEGERYLERARRRLLRQRDADADTYDQTDLLKLRTYQADVTELALSTRTGRALTAKALAALVGRPAAEGPLPEADDIVPLALAPRPAADYVRAALVSQPAVLAAEARLAAARGRVREHRGALVPELFLGGWFQIGHSAASDLQPSPFAHDSVNGWFGGLGVGLRMTLDIPEKVARLRAAAAEVAREEWSVAATRRQAGADVERRAETVASLRRELPVHHAAMKAARAWVMARVDTFDAGLETFDEVLDALVEFYGRQLANLQAIYDFNVAVAALSRAVGCDVTSEACLGAAVP